MKKQAFAALAALIVGGVAGCTPMAKQKYGEANEYASHAAHETAGAMKADAASAGQSISQSASSAGMAIKNDETSIKVKQAIESANDLKTTDLKVDTDGKTVTIRGYVETASQKARVDSIAKNQLGPEFKVSNRLTVQSN